MSPLVTFVIVNYKCAEKASSAVQSIHRYADVPFEIVVVDNSESRAELSMLQRLLPPDVTVVASPKNGGFGFGCNLGAKAAQGKYLFFLNPDAALTSRCVARFVAHLDAEPQLGAVGGRLIYRDGDEGHSSGTFISLRRPLQMMKGNAYLFRDRLLKRSVSKSPKYKVGDTLRKVDWCSGADLLVRASDFKAVGGFDESYFLYYEECDLQYRLYKSLGLTSMIDGSVDILHEDGGTGLESEPKRRFIEEGCLHFVRDHRPRWYARLYHALLVCALATETSLQLLALRTDQVPSGIRLTKHVASL